MVVNTGSGGANWKRRQSYLKRTLTKKPTREVTSLSLNATISVTTTYVRGAHPAANPAPKITMEATIPFFIGVVMTAGVPSPPIVKWPAIIIIDDIIKKGLYLRGCQSHLYDVRDTVFEG